MRSAAQDWATAAFRTWSAAAAFRVFGRGAGDTRWHEIQVFSTARRDADSRWPLWRNHCITWTANVIAVGRDFATRLLEEQSACPATPDRPVAVRGGRLMPDDESGPRTCSELLAHECGHTAQARRLGFLYWPTVGSLTLFREGPKWYHRFENEASRSGLFGGIVPGTVRKELRSWTP
jgi:hypothetical protein